MERSWMSLDGPGIYNNTEFQQSGICVGDAYNSISYRHWISELRNLAWKLKVEGQDLFNHVCVINANAYYASCGHDPWAAGLLPSQYYLRILLNYLVNNKKGKKPLFIIPSTSLHEVWRKVLGYWIENEIMMSQDLILIDQPNSKLKLSPDLIGKENVKKILKRIK